MPLHRRVDAYIPSQAFGVCRVWGATNFLVVGRASVSRIYVKRNSRNFPCLLQMLGKPFQSADWWNAFATRTLELAQGKMRSQKHSNTTNQNNKTQFNYPKLPPETTARGLHPPLTNDKCKSNQPSRNKQDSENSNDTPSLWLFLSVPKTLAKLEIGEKCLPDKMRHDEGKKQLHPASN